MKPAKGSRPAPPSRRIALALRRLASGVVGVLALYGAWHLGIGLSAGEDSKKQAASVQTESPVLDPSASSARDAVSAPSSDLRSPEPSPVVPAPPAAEGPAAEVRGVVKEEARKSELPTPATAVEILRRRRLTMPVGGVDPSQLRDDFADSRGGGRSHEALDILAPRSHPVVAVEGGRIAKLFQSRLGGRTIYQFGPSEQFSYYYAHLERYAEGLREGDRVSRGQVIGYVGTSGNAPPDTPHLHFAIYLLPAQKQWWKGEPINPFPILRDAR